MNQEFFSVLVQVVAALGLAGIILLLSILMGKRSSVRKPADIPYECGMIPMGEGAPMFSVKFYMVAMLFVIFDLEVVFLYPWAVNFRDYVMMNPERGVFHGEERGQPWEIPWRGKIPLRLIPCLYVSFADKFLLYER